MSTTEATCERHRTPTQLACAQCGKPACPKCLVWTEVGQKCIDCVPSRAKRETSRSRVPVLVLGVAAVLAVLAFVVFGGSDSTSEVPRAANAGATQPGIGVPARDGSMTFVVKGFECVGKQLEGTPAGRQALGRFCVLRLDATNTGNQPTFLNPTTQVLLDGQRRRFAPDMNATLLYQRTLPGGTGASPFGGPTSQMNPGTQVSTALVYDIPEDVSPVRAELHGGQTIGVTVRLTKPGS